MTNKVDNFLADVTRLVNSTDWKVFNTECNAMCEGITQWKVKALFLTDAGSKALYESDTTLGYSTYRNHYNIRNFIHQFVRSSVNAYPHFGDDLIGKSKIAEVKLYCLENGFYSNLSIVDMMTSTSKAERMFAVKNCSFSKLQSFTKDEDAKIRRAAFERLGPSECLDEMLTDKAAEIRCLGAKIAPFGYKGLDTAIVKEIAKGPFTLMVSKVSASSLPLILANRNLKSRWVSKIIEERMTHATNFNNE